jgi:hypothetical protein
MNPIQGGQNGTSLPFRVIQLLRIFFTRSLQARLTQGFNVAIYYSLISKR